MSSGRSDAAVPAKGARSAGASSRSLTFRLGAWYAGTLLVGLAALGALALFAVRRAVFRSDDIVVHERLERHRAVLERVGLPEFERAIGQAAELEGERGKAGECDCRHDFPHRFLPSLCVF